MQTKTTTQQTWMIQAASAFQVDAATYYLESLNAMDRGQASLAKIHQRRAAGCCAAARRVMEG